MIVRNLPYPELNKDEQRIVRRHYKACMHDTSMDCRKIHSDLISFWEAHREADTDYGKYDGWIE